MRLYNTLSRKVEEFKPIDGKQVRMYTCGPTVYDYAHIGNLRGYITADLLYRTLKFDGYQPKWVMNITDIDDKTIKGAIAEYGANATKDDLRNFTQKYFDAFLADLAEVNVLKDEIEFIRVTDKMAEIQDFIIKLIEKGYAYKADDGSIYFSIEKYQTDFGDYGQLVGEKFLEGKKIGARVKVDEYEKDNLSDFALWKAHTEEDGQIFWDHDILGKGRPGWHIECSVINHEAFGGKPTDIHTGGVDLIFPHHTNEIAQSQALLGKGNFVKYWSHTEHLLVDGKKMAKSSNNFYTLAYIKKQGFTGIDLRYLFFDAHYRTQQNFTWDSLQGAHNGLMRNAEKQMGSFSLEQIKLALSDDLTIRDAIADIINQKLPFSLFVDLLGLNVRIEPVPEEVEALKQQRQKAKEQKDFSKSDELRKQIEDLGYEVMDTDEGQKIRKK